MPRGKRKTPEQRNTKKDQDRRKSEFWSARIRSGLKAKESYVQTATEVVSFLKAKHDRLYDDKTVKDTFLDFKGVSAVSVPVTAQMKNSLAPRLYLARPRRNVITRSEDTVMIALCRVLQAYLNYTAVEANFAEELRGVIDDGLLRGRAVLRQKWDDVRRIITSVHVSSLDLVIDPDFFKVKDARWIAFRRRQPLWELKRRIKEKRRTKGLDKLSYVRTEDEPENDREVMQTDPNEVAGSCRIVESWEIYSKMGCGWRGLDMEDMDRLDDSKDFVKLEIVVGHECPLSEGEWDIPLHMDSDWPMSTKDLIETPDTLWPESLHGQILSSQKAVDLLTSLRLTSCKNRDRTILMGAADLAQSIQNQLRNGTAAEFLSVDIPKGHTLDSVVKVVDFGAGSAESALERDFLMQQIEIATGVTSQITGAQDNAAADRSATATNRRAAGSETRVGDFKHKIEEMVTDAARKEAIMARLFLGEEDIAPYVRSADINYYYIRVDVAGQPLPVRNPFDEEERAKLEKKGVLGVTIQDIFPSASRYFETPDEAIMKAMELWQVMLVHQDPRVIELTQGLMVEGEGQINQMTGLPPSINVDIVTPERVWFDTSGMSMEELMREMAYEIATGSGLKFDKQAEQQNANDMLQTLLPVVVGNMDYAGANKLLKIRDDAYDVPDDRRITLQPPPPPPQPAPGEGGEEKKEKKS